MVTTAQVSGTIDRSLRLVLADMAFLPEMAAAWPDEPADNRLNYSLEWDDLIGRVLLLHQAYRSGELTPAQSGQYHEVVAQLHELGPLMRQLDLSRPPEEVLETVA